ncbi:MAG TPA: type II toxin-antitoxin system HicB family antitoxin [Humisphaera sp.]|jgi:predicted RNase H-like HicB family nuclease|nr:type II toxin-antitoxin system HicB family antitoxin [Humisphaera sp.]
MRQRYHTIIRPESDGSFVGWVEEIPGAITQAPSLQACREGLREALSLLLEIHRDEARQGADENCILEAIEIDVEELPVPSEPQAVA